MSPIRVTYSRRRWSEIISSFAFFRDSHKFLYHLLSVFIPICLHKNQEMYQSKLWALLRRRKASEQWWPRWSCSIGEGKSFSLESFTPHDSVSVFSVEFSFTRANFFSARRCIRISNNRQLSVRAKHTIWKSNSWMGNVLSRRCVSD